MARLIVHSDDLGLHPEIDRAILEAAAAGCLTSASLIANGWSARKALAACRGQPGLGVGLHLNAVRGRPLCDPAEVASLVDGSGRFLNSAARLMIRSLRGCLCADEMTKEYRRQVLYLLAGGVRPTHFDGEKHTHLLIPESVEAIRRLQEEFDIRRLRIVRERPLLRVLRSTGIRVAGSLRQRGKLWLVEARARAARRRLPGSISPPLSYGVLESGRFRPERALRVLAAILENDALGTVEWMFHLGRPFEMSAGFRAEFGSFFLGASSRAQEAAFLLSAGVRELLDAHRDKLVSYAAL